MQAQSQGKIVHFVAKSPSLPDTAREVGRADVKGLRPCFHMAVLATVSHRQDGKSCKNVAKTATVKLIGEWCGLLCMAYIVENKTRHGHI